MEKIANWDWSDFPELTSTNDVAVEMSKDLLSEKIVVTAKAQTKGRGRRGRDWESMDGNLFMSYAFPFDMVNLGKLVFAVSLSLLQAIKKTAPDSDIKLKWPNDVLVDDKKISGILLEKAENMYIVVGIGVNINKAPDLANYATTCLKDIGVSITRLEFLNLFIEFFDHNLKKMQNNDFVEIKNLWLENVKGLGDEIIVTTEKEPVKGVFGGVDDNGSLLLQTSQGVMKIYAGDVFYKERSK